MTTCNILSSQAKQVLFTADLKIFSSYGMPASPSTSTEVTPRSTPIIATPVSLPSSSKRARKSAPLDADELPVIIGATEDTSLAERVKRRRRA